MPGSRFDVERVRSDDGLRPRADDVAPDVQHVRVADGVLNQAVEVDLRVARIAQVAYVDRARMEFVRHVELEGRVIPDIDRHGRRTGGIERIEAADDQVLRGVVGDRHAGGPVLEAERGPRSVNDARGYAAVSVRLELHLPGRVGHVSVHDDVVRLHGAEGHAVRVVDRDVDSLDDLGAGIDLKLDARARQDHHVRVEDNGAVHVARAFVEVIPGIDDCPVLLRFRVVTIHAGVDLHIQVASRDRGPVFGRDTGRGVELVDGDHVRVAAKGYAPPIGVRSRVNVLMPGLDENLICSRDLGALPYRHAGRRVGLHPGDGVGVRAEPARA